MTSIRSMTKDFSEEMAKDGWPYWLVYISMFLTLCIVKPFMVIKGWFKK